MTGIVLPMERPVVLHHFTDRSLTRCPIVSLANLPSQMAIHHSTLTS